jgi:hypothetical protein
MVRSFSNYAFDPEVADLMGRAFDAAWDRLIGSESAYADGPKAEAAREALALKIIELGDRGERDLQRMAERALRELGMSALSGTH